MSLSSASSTPKATGALLCLALALSLFGVGCQSSPAGGLAIRVSAAHSRLWRHGQIELDLTGAPPAANPFDPSQIDLQVAFTPPQGEPVVVPAFYDQDYDAARRPVGRPGWKARFSPSQSGAWTAQARSHAGGEIRVSAPIPILVAEGVDAARRRGAVRVSQTNPRYLAFENGETFTPIGINLGWWNGDPLGDYERWFDALQRNGATVARIWMASWSFGLEWNDTGLGDYTKRLDRAWLLDQVLRMAEQRGIYVIPVLLNHGAFSLTVNPEWDANPYNSALGGPCETPQDFLTDARARELFQRRLRYIAARWASSPNLLAWEWWNEVDLAAFSGPDVEVPWLQEMTAALRRYDPYGRLTTISYARGTPEQVARLPEIDVLQRHEYNAGDPYKLMPLIYREMSSLAPKPVLFGEFGSSANGEKAEPTNPDALHFHNGLWASAFAGFAAPTLYWWWDNYIEPNHYWHHLGGLTAFLNGEDLAALAPITATANVTSVVTLARGNSERAIVWVRNSRYTAEAGAEEVRRILLAGKRLPAGWQYQPPHVEGALIRLTELLPGSYRVEWIDTLTHQRLAEAVIDSAAGQLDLAVPRFNRDLALRVVRLP